MEDTLRIKEMKDEEISQYRNTKCLHGKHLVKIYRFIKNRLIFVATMIDIKLIFL